MQPKTILVAIGAALTSALLFAGLATQSAFAVGFALAAPVPIAIAGLGFGAAAGFVAALVAPVLIYVLTGNVPSTVTLALGMSLPTAICAYLALQRSEVSPDVETPGSPHALETATTHLSWMPIARILFVLAVCAAVACVFIGWALNYDPATIEPAFREAFIGPNADLDPAEQVQIEDLVSVIVSLVPLIQPAVLTLTLVVCLYFGASIARRSGRLDRPKDDLPAAASMPQDALILFAVALAGTFLDGPAGLVATVFSGALGTAFGLIGLARLHLKTRGRPARGLILFVVYSTIFFLTFPLFIFVVIGIVDVWRNGERLRTRRPG